MASLELSSARSEGVDGTGSPSQTAGRSRRAPRRLVEFKDTPDVRVLGEALKARSAEVLELTIARAGESGKPSEGVLREGLEGICNVATKAVSEWMTSGTPEASLKAGRGGWHLFGRLAAERAAPLHEITRRCLYWRDAAGDVLADSAEQYGVRPEALTQALAVLQLTVDFTLVRMCEVFEAERRRSDEALESRLEELSHPHHPER